MKIIDFVVSYVVDYDRLISWLIPARYKSFKTFIIYNEITLIFFSWTKKSSDFKKQKHLEFFLPGGRKKSGSSAPVSECIDACKTKITKPIHPQYRDNIYLD